MEDPEAEAEEGGAQAGEKEREGAQVPGKGVEAGEGGEVRVPGREVRAKEGEAEANLNLSSQTISGLNHV